MLSSSVLTACSKEMHPRAVSKTLSDERARTTPDDPPGLADPVPPNDPGPLPGASFGARYRIERELGRGGMGRVFAARDLKLGRQVALKVLSRGLADEQQVMRFEREARAAGALSHPNIVVIYDAGIEGASPYIISELLEGVTLRQRLAKGRIPAGAAVEWCIQLARGLAAAHEKGVIHRDLKPENLFIGADDRLKILDFGIAKIVDPAAAESPITTETGAVLGTVGYMSPEQARGAHADHRSDIFSAGAILYEMLSGGRAFSGGSDVETAYAIIHREPPPLPGGVPESLARLVRRCLEKDPERRYQSARDVALDLESFRDGPALPGRARSAVPRRVAVLAAVALAVTAAALLLLRGARNAPPSFRQITFHAGAIWSARFAPDGQTVVYTSAARGPPAGLFATRLGSPEYRRVDLPEASLLAVSARGELAVLLRPRLRRFEYSLGTLARASLEGDALPREILESVEYADWAPDGAALAVVRTVGARCRLEYPIGRSLYEAAGWISHARVSPRGDLVAFIDHPDANDDAGSIAVVDQAGKVRVLSPGWKSAQGLAWSASGDEVWFTAAATDAAGAQNALRGVSLSGKQRALAQVAGNLKLEDVARDGRVLLTQPDRRLGLALIPAGEKVERDLSWLNPSFLGDLSRDGGAVLFTVEAGGANYFVYLRKTDGSPAVRLGEGFGAALSPDGRWALALLGPPAPALALLPIGAGEPRMLHPQAIAASRAKWLPDGKRIVLAGVSADRASRLYVFDLDGATRPRAISEEGVSGSWLAVSPDGALIAALDAQGRTALYPADGAGRRALPQIEPGEVPVGWSAEGELLVARLPALPARVERLDLARGSREPWKTVRPEAAGAFGIQRLQVSPDGSIAFNYGNMTTHLYLLEGL
jgi:dipeptidyl aminopeptidase/acylaminoacyl peptidase